MQATDNTRLSSYQNNNRENNVLVMLKLTTRQSAQVLGRPRNIFSALACNLWLIPFNVNCKITVTIVPLLPQSWNFSLLK